ncbi:hypothetical protein [Salinibacter altiplanensis]|uniref:hypothetical protein n=1 Tax=Salinibacter altiplanensis TaxID=1803181 RepID=UPI0012FFF55D|nr:hypothetical protein [Salinibacter altiplanensis]
MPSASAQQRDRTALTFGGGGLVQATGPPWTYVAGFLLMVTVILAGLPVGL